MSHRGLIGQWCRQSVCMCVWLGFAGSSMSLVLQTTEFSSASYIMQRAEQMVDTAKEEIPHFIFDEHKSSGRCWLFYYRQMKKDTDAATQSQCQDFSACNSEHTGLRSIISFCLLSFPTSPSTYTEHSNSKVVFQCAGGQSMGHISSSKRWLFHVTRSQDDTTLTAIQNARHFHNNSSLIKKKEEKNLSNFKYIKSCTSGLYLASQPFKLHLPFKFRYFHLLFHQMLWCICVSI